MSNKINKTIAVFMPSKTSFYEGLLLSIIKAFEEHTYNVIGYCGFLNGDEMILFCEKHKPDIFFEMNRCKNEISNFPTDILHICWLVDLMGRKLENIGGSDIIYFFSTEWMKDFKSTKNCKIGWLPPASDPLVYYPVKNNKIFQSIFLGHISKPWTEELLKRVICEKENKRILFDDILREFELKWSLQDSIVNNDQYINEVIKWLRDKGFFGIDIENRILRYDIGCRIIRKGRRAYFIDWLLENMGIESLGIFGGANWAEWEQYRSKYQKELHAPSDINLVFSQSKSLIHEGVGCHFRVFDAMLSGIPVILRKSKQDSLYGGLGTLFIENEDYIAIDVDDKNYLNIKLTDEVLKCVSKNARQKALLNHTWFHRLSQVKKDIDDFRK